MKPDRRTRIAVLLLLALVAGLPGLLSAACGPLCAARSAMPCCHPAGGAPTVKARSCCETLETLAPVQVSRAVQPAPAGPVALAAPLALPAEPLAARPLPAPPPAPPPLHEGVGLYTLHAVFLI